MSQASATGRGRPDARTACSWLFVPGHRPDRFDKAVASGADLVVCDLEDSVALDAKERARGQVARWLAGGGVACVRINAHGTPFHDDDVAALVGAPGLVAVMVPKAEQPRRLTELSERLAPGAAVVGLVETALGVHRVHELAMAPGVARLAFGSVDLALDLGCEDAALPLLFARSALVLACRVAGIAAPVDGVTRQLDDPSAIAADTAAAAALGFGGKLCVHPHQVSTVNAGFRPSDADIRRAREMLAAAAGGSAARMDGQMIDRPVVEQARRVLRRAGAAAPDSPPTT